jgi:DNA adenine methylase
LIKHLIPFIPEKIEKYYEPFLGGGSMFFFLAPAKAEISDASGALIESYKSVRRDVERTLRFLRPLRPSRTAFNRIKKMEPTNDGQIAGSFIFLNRACWNGLYRVNSDGVFNVPYGWPRTNFLIDEENLRECAKQLRRRSITLRQQDFEDIEDRVSRDDFVFLDPPYVTAHNMNGFVDWNERIFSWADQVRLASMAKRLIAKGANVLITNADHDDVRKLYAGLIYRRIVRTSTLAADKSKRTKTSEAVPAHRGASSGDVRWMEREAAPGGAE